MKKVIIIVGAMMLFFGVSANAATESSYYEVTWTPHDIVIRYGSPDQPGIYDDRRMHDHFSDKGDYDQIDAIATEGVNLSGSVRAKSLDGDGQYVYGPYVSSDGATSNASQGATRGADYAGYSYQ